MENILFMIHGMWGGGWYWENYIQYFQELGYRCIAPTLRHHNALNDHIPDPSLGTTSLLDYAGDLEHEIRQLPSTPVIIGHSMGGLLAQILASRGLARAAVLLTTAPPAGISAFTPSVVRSFFNGLTTWGFWRKPIFPTFNEVVYSTFNLIPEKKRKALYDRLVHESGRAAAEIGFFFFDSNGAARVDTGKVTCPLLVIGAGKDRITPAKVVRKVARLYKQAEYKEFPDQAHWVVGEPGWEEIADFIADWLESVCNPLKIG